MKKVNKYLRIAGMIYFLTAITENAYAKQIDESKLIGRFESNYQKSYKAYVGIFESKKFRDDLFSAHLNVINAIRSGNNINFNDSLLKFMNINRVLILGASEAAELFTHGAGPPGSSAATAASGANAGMSAAIAYSRSRVNSSTVICSYMFGTEFGWIWNDLHGCSKEAGDKLYDALRSRRVTIENFMHYVSEK